jgi:hypothetical protein
MLTACAKHVVAKAASNAATVNFIVVTIGESLELVGSALIYKKLDSKPENKKIHNILRLCPGLYGSMYGITRNSARGVVALLFSPNVTHNGPGG